MKSMSVQSEEQSTEVFPSVQSVSGHFLLYSTFIFFLNIGHEMSALMSIAGRILLNQ